MTDITRHSTTYAARTVAQRRSRQAELMTFAAVSGGTLLLAAWGMIASLSMVA